MVVLLCHGVAPALAATLTHPLTVAELSHGGTQQPPAQPPSRPRARNGMRFFFFIADGVDMQS